MLVMAGRKFQLDAEEQNYSSRQYRDHRTTHVDRTIHTDKVIHDDRVSELKSELRQLLRESNTTQPI